MNSNRRKSKTPSNLNKKKAQNWPKITLLVAVLALTTALIAGFTNSTSAEKASGSQQIMGSKVQNGYAGAAPQEEARQKSAARMRRGP